MRIEIDGRYRKGNGTRGRLAVDVTEDNVADMQPGCLMRLDEADQKQ